MDPTTAVAAAAAEFEESGMSQQEIADSIAKQNASNNGINLPAGYESSTGILFGSPEYDAECEYSSDEELVPETETARQWRVLMEIEAAEEEERRKVAEGGQ